MKKTILIFLMAIFIMIGCTSKEKEVTFSKTSQDIWGEIIINDTDKITVPTTLKQLGKEYSYNDVKVKGEGYVATSLEKDKFHKIQVIVNENEVEDVDEDSIICQIMIYKTTDQTASICGIKIGDAIEKVNSILGKPDYILKSKSDTKKDYLYYYGKEDKEKQFLRFAIVNNIVEQVEVRYLPEEYLNKK